nr:MAG TPA: hypothetical protein [Caudoviricetes sp.]
MRKAGGLAGVGEGERELERGRALPSHKIKTYSVLKQRYVGFSHKIKTYSALKQHNVSLFYKIQ